MALYSAKQAGRNTVCLASLSSRQAATSRN
jgi:hypothetical protein